MASQKITETHSVKALDVSLDLFEKGIEKFSIDVVDFFCYYNTKYSDINSRI
ncbi:hypothetical protein V7D15_07965 [Thermoanaerobacter thermohydrosulfuricus]